MRDVSASNLTDRPYIEIAVILPDAEVTHSGTSRSKMTRHHPRSQPQVLTLSPPTLTQQTAPPRDSPSPTKNQFTPSR